MGYVKLARPWHWVKNLLVLLPLLFSGEFLNRMRLAHGIMGVVAFCLMSSAIYCFNDIRDVERDRQSTTKCKRPIASGQVSVRGAGVLCLVLLAGAIFCSLHGAEAGFAVLLGYLVLNLGYSCGLKNVPLLDVTILAAGFLLRMLYGGAVTGIAISHWLYLTVMAASFYLGLGKRRNERRDQTGDTRAVLQYYSEGFLTGSMQMCLTLAVLFYALWTVDGQSENLIWTVPLVLLICMKYAMDIEGESDGDPVEVLFHDRILLALVAVLGLVLVWVIY